MTESEKAALAYAEEIGGIFAQCDQHDIFRAFLAGAANERELAKGLEDKILNFCNDNENMKYMWAVKIVSLILDCDFRDAKVALAKWRQYDSK